jgi:hypothetical protein
MAAVVAAIGAAFLAGVVALYREFRQQQREFLVAARVVHATFNVASAAISTSLKSNGWAPFNNMPGEASFSAAWDAYKGDLASHLNWSEWLDVEGAVTIYLALVNTKQDRPPQDAKDALSKVVDKLEMGQKSLQPYCLKRLSVWQSIRRRVHARKR